MQLDELDLRILKELQNSGRISNVDLAALVGLSPPPCLRRLRALERAGVIRQYAALLNPRVINLGVTVFVQVRLESQMERRLELFEHAIKEQPAVVECYFLAGDADYLLRVMVPDMAGYEEFLRTVLFRIESAAGIKSSFSLKQVKYFTGVPLSAVTLASSPKPGEVDPPDQPGESMRETPAWQRPE